jgi:glycosyltransferase involved in cell wall biosynthesis
LIVENPESAQEIAENINTLFDQDLRQSMSQNARALAEQFSVERNTREMLKVYQEIIAIHGK